MLVLRVALLLSTAHGFMVTAGPRCSASMSTRRSFVVAASDIDKCCAGPPCPPQGARPLIRARAVASPPQDCRRRVPTPVRLGLQVRRHHEGAHALHTAVHMHMQQHAMHAQALQNARSPAPRCAALHANPQIGSTAPDAIQAQAESRGGGMRRAAEGCPSHDAPSVKEGGLCSCTPLTVPPPISVQRMIRDATGNTKYEFGDGSKALADGSKDAAEKAREAVVAMAHTVGIGQRTYARACEYELPRPCSVPPRPFTHPPTRPGIDPRKLVECAGSLHVWLRGVGGLSVRRNR